MACANAEQYPQIIIPYFVIVVLDVADGIAARNLNQCKFNTLEEFYVMIHLKLDLNMRIKM